LRISDIIGPFFLFLDYECLVVIFCLGDKNLISFNQINGILTLSNPRMSDKGVHRKRGTWLNFTITDFLSLEIIPKYFDGILACVFENDADRLVRM
jgi:hypothetical protein